MASVAQLAPLLARMTWNERPFLGDLADLLWSRGQLPSGPPGDGRPVLVLPGYLMVDGATVALRRYLTRLGYDARGWGLGQNTGQVSRFAAAVGEQLAGFDQPVALVGWSLGGVIARQVARDRPGAVSQVVTLGSPVDPHHPTAFSGLIPDDKRAAYAHAVTARESVPVPTPLTVVYTKGDRVVPWQSSIDRVNPQADHVEVDCAHSGLVVSRAVFAVLAERLGLGVQNRNIDASSDS